MLVDRSGLAGSKVQYQSGSQSVTEGKSVYHWTGKEGKWGADRQCKEAGILLESLAYVWSTICQWATQSLSPINSHGLWELEPHCSWTDDPLDGRGSHKPSCQHPGLGALGTHLGQHVPSASGEPYFLTHLVDRGWVWWQMSAVLYRSLDCRSVARAWSSAFWSLRQVNPQLHITVYNFS